MVSLKKILNKILVRINSEADYVVERGHLRQGWDYIKWNSGKAECFREAEEYYAPSGTAVGNLYRIKTEVYLPGIFNINPSQIFVSSMDESNDNIISMNGCAIDSENIKIYAWTTANKGTYVYASCYVRGNWK